MTYEEPLVRAFEYAEINTQKRAAMFLANTAHETGGFMYFEEMLGYSAKRLAQVFPKRFKGPDGPNALAKKIGGDPIAIARQIYGGRMGNGGPETMDGYLFRGRGLPMLTGRDNYEWFDRDMNMNGKIVSNPNMLVQPYFSAMAAGHFVVSRGLNKFADSGEIVAYRKRWNGGSIGLAPTVTLYNQFLTVIDKVI